MAKVKHNGTIKEAVNCKIKVNGVWKQCYQVLEKNDGEWREVWAAGGIATNVRIVATSSASTKEVTYEGLTDTVKLTNLRCQALDADGNVVEEYYIAERTTDGMTVDLPNDVGWFTIQVYSAYDMIRYSTSYDSSIVRSMIITIGRIDPVE